MNEGTSSQTPIHLPQGFTFAASNAGTKASGRPDLALIEAALGTTAAAMFTRNRVVAAPIEVGRASLKASRGRVRAVLVNSGNANCATGPAGLLACRQLCQEAARLLGVKADQVLPSSTGIIGVPLPLAKLQSGLPQLVAGRVAAEDGFRDFADAIMTTDKRMKIASTVFEAGKSRVSLAGVAKGSGMIHPQLATMLVYILTDIAAAPAELQRLLRAACDESFNSISVDGDTSTNDTVLLLASGASGVKLNNSVRTKFAKALTEVCRSLAHQVVCDGEGVTHVIRLHIEQARTREEAVTIARTISHSLLVKTAWAGADPNWGRILAAVGRSGIAVDPRKISIMVGDQVLCRNGVASAFDQDKAHAHLALPECDVRVRLQRGRGSVIFTTTDLTAEYVHINADYST